MSWRGGRDEIDALVRRDGRQACQFYQEGSEEIQKIPGRGLPRYVFLWNFGEDNWLRAAFGFLILNFLLALELAEKLLTKSELEIARAIQLSLYPASNPKVAHLDVSSHFQPALEVGGDYYDYSLEGSRRFTVILGDVSGHARRGEDCLIGCRSWRHPP
jgi:hypothetical protein